jgi:hypothetical protein
VSPKMDDHDVDDVIEAVLDVAHRGRQLVHLLTER